MEPDCPIYDSLTSSECERPFLNCLVGEEDLSLQILERHKSCCSRALVEKEYFSSNERTNQDVFSNIQVEVRIFFSRYAKKIRTALFPE